MNTYWFSIQPFFLDSGKSIMNFQRMQQWTTIESMPTGIAFFFDGKINYIQQGNVIIYSKCIYKPCWILLNVVYWISFCLLTLNQNFPIILFLEISGFWKKKNQLIYTTVKRLLENIAIKFFLIENVSFSCFWRIFCLLFLVHLLSCIWK